MSARAVVLLVLALALAPMLAGCRAERAGPVLDPAPEIVLLVSIDTLRPDHLGLYGYGRDTSPSLDALARDAVVFEDANATAPWTLPSHASLLTGLYPYRHRLKSHDRRLGRDLTTLASAFARAGWHTAAIVNSKNLSNRFGLDRGFKDFLYIEESVEREEPSTVLTDEAIRQIEQRGDAPLFLFLHSYDVHSDYRARPEYEKRFVRPYAGDADGTTSQLDAFRHDRFPLDPARDRDHLVDLYDAGVRQTDDELERLWDALRADSLLDRTLLVVTSDHGEEFFEHGSVLHGSSQYTESIHVPLFLRYPRALPATRISAPVSLVDVMPTLIALLGLPSPGGLDGRDLSPLWRDPDTAVPLFEARPILGEADHSAEAFDITRSIRVGRYKLHYDRLHDRYRLFDLATDPGEMHDLASEHPERVAALREQLSRYGALGKRYRAPVEDKVELSDEEWKQLEALGYGR